MTINVDNRPTLSAAEAGDLVRRHFGLTGRLTPLPAEWDQNFKLQCEGSDVFVVKIANRGTRAELLEFQNAALERLASSWKAARGPRPVRSLSGTTLCTVPGSDGDDQ